MADAVRKFGPQVARHPYKLWVDDIRTEPAGWLRARTVTEAIRMLDTLDIDEVSLDHDISLKVSIGTGDPRPFASPETFEPVARFIAACVKASQGYRSLKVTLHTANPIGAATLRQILDGFLSVTVAPRPPCNRFEADRGVVHVP